jgi:hypothetical protein
LNIVWEQKEVTLARQQDTFSTYELPSESEIEAAAARTYDAVKDPHTDPAQLNDAAQALGRMLLSHVTQGPTKTNHCGTGWRLALRAFPNYCPYRPKTGQLLIAKHVIVNAPSAVSPRTVEQQESGRRTPPPNVLAAFGDPVFQSKLFQYGSYVE